MHFLAFIWFSLSVVQFTQLTGALALIDAGFGVNYGRVADDLPSPPQVANLVVSQGIKKLKIFDASPIILQAFANKGVKIIITVPNDQIPILAASVAGASAWFEVYGKPFTSEIQAILIGNEVLKFSPRMSSILVPAMQNLYNVLKSLHLDEDIKISTPHAMDVLEKGSSWPPSSAVFQQRHVPTMQSLMNFLNESGSFFMINVYPYFSYREDRGVNLPLDFVVLQSSKSYFTDPITQLGYTNLLDAELDAMYSAMSKRNHGELQIIIGETGWPTAGGIGATSQNAAIFNGNLVRRTIQPNSGTPMKPNWPIQAYAFALFNENLKHNLMEQNFGLFYPNMTKVYPIQFK